MMNHESKRPVSLEDLLRLKRAERPPAEFWLQFERDLRAKQLAAIVEKRPWWSGLSRAFGGVARYHLPLGATAILAVTFLTVRQYQVAPAIPDRTPDAAVALVAAGTLSGVAHDAAVLKPASGAVSAPAAELMPASAAPVALSSEATAPGRLTQMIALLGSAESSETAGRTLSPAAQSIATNLAATQETEPELAGRFFAGPSGLEQRLQPARKPAVDPLAQMTTPADQRRNRLLASALPTAASLHVPARTSERFVKNISDDRLREEAVSRFGASGDRLGWKL